MRLLHMGILIGLPVTVISQTVTIPGDKFSGLLKMGALKVAAEVGGFGYFVQHATSERHQVYAFFDSNLTMQSQVDLGTDYLGLYESTVQTGYGCVVLEVQHRSSRVINFDLDKKSITTMPILFEEGRVFKKHPIAPLTLVGLSEGFALIATTGTVIDYTNTGTGVEVAVFDRELQPVWHQEIRARKRVEVMDAVAAYDHLAILLREQDQAEASVFELRLLSEDGQQFNVAWPAEPRGIPFELRSLSDGSFLVSGIATTPSPLEPNRFEKDNSRGLMFTKIGTNGDIAWQSSILWHEIECEPVGLLKMVYCREPAASTRLLDVQELETGDLRVFVSAGRGVTEVEISDAGDVQSTAFFYTGYGRRRLFVDSAGRVLLTYNQFLDQYIGVISIDPTVSEYRIEIPEKDPACEAIPVAHDRLFLAYSDKKTAVLKLVNVVDLTPVEK